MKIYELILLLSFIAVVIDYWRNRELRFNEWLLDMEFFSFMTRCAVLILAFFWVLSKLDASVVIDFLNFKLW